MHHLAALNNAKHHFSGARWAAACHQCDHRQTHLPEGTQQALVIDLRGQNVSAVLQERLRARVVHSSQGLIHPDNIHFLTDQESED
jgi:hypothetical protein